MVTNANRNMMHFHAMLLALLALFAFRFDATLANHSVCGWTGPGTGDPAKYNYKQWCVAEKVKIIPDDPSKPTLIEYICNHVRVADWGYLRASTLELSTPCNGGGFAKGNRGKCPAQIWGYCLQKSKDIKDLVGNCLFQTAYNDCEWPGNFTMDALPGYMSIYTGP